MKDLINRQDAIDAIFGRSHEIIKMRIGNLPSAQPVIIRCKDCKYYVVHTMFGRSAGWCERNCDEDDKLLAYVTELDDFCSRAERRTR